MRTLMIGLAALLFAAETAKEPAKETTGETKPPASAAAAVDSYTAAKVKIEAQTALMTADAVSKLTIEQLKAIDAKTSERVLLIARSLSGPPEFHCQKAFTATIGLSFRAELLRKDYYA